MNSVIYLALPWVVSGTTITFLVFSAWHNRRTGYRKLRFEQSALEDAACLLTEIRTSIATDGNAPVVEANRTPEIDHSSADALLKLSSALGHRVAAPAKTPAATPAPAPVETRTPVEVGVRK
jgi:hypothetical protein